MEFEEFKEKFKNHLSIINKTITDEQILKFYRYMELLLEWNEKINLTAITNPEDIILKHFIDSLTIEEYINKRRRAYRMGCFLRHRQSCYLYSTPTNGFHQFRWFWTIFHILL